MFTIQPCRSFTRLDHSQDSIHPRVSEQFMLACKKGTRHLISGEAEREECEDKKGQGEVNRMTK